MSCVVFTGVSGSGKSSLVFGTIAAESQRLINEIYRSFVQGFMPTMAVVHQGGMCPPCEGMGRINDIDLNQIYDETKSQSAGALKVPGYSTDGWHVRNQLLLRLRDKGNTVPRLRSGPAGVLP